MIKRFKSLIVGSFAENGEEATTEYKPDDPTADDTATDENSVNLFKPGLVMDMSESSWVAGLIPGGLLFFSYDLFYWSLSAEI